MTRQEAAGDVDRPVLEVEFAPLPIAPGLIRDAVATALQGWLSGRRINDARLMVSELVTNAVQHAGMEDEDRLTVRVWISPSEARIEVCDPGPTFAAEPATPVEGQIGGWGLYLVQELSDEWMVEGGNGETCVSFRLNPN